MRFAEKVHALKNPSPCLACSKYLHVRAARHVHRSESGEHGSGIQRSTRIRANGVTTADPSKRADGTGR